MKKFTVADTRNAMRIAMKLKKEYSIKFLCGFNQISLSICLKEAYASILKAKEVVKTVVVNVVKKTVSYIFSQDEISIIKGGWNKFYAICREFGYIISITGTERFTHKINVSKDDFNTIKQMMVEG